MNKLNTVVISFIMHSKQQHLWSYEVDLIYEETINYSFSIGKV